jgi:pachytene checkpoint protein 2
MPRDTGTLNSAIKRGVLFETSLPNALLADSWNKIIIPEEQKTRLLCQSLFEFTVRGVVSQISVPLHGIIVLAGPPGTGKTSLARGLANRIAESFDDRRFHFIEVEPHSLASANLGRSQQSVRDLLQTTIAEQAQIGPLIVLLDEVETLAPDRRRMSLEANPVDVHRATDAVLASVDQLASSHAHILFIATTNFREAVDGALLSRADLIEWIGMPGLDGCEAILKDTLQAFGAKWPSISKLSARPEIRGIARQCVGLDARQIRKAVVAACASSRDVALNPNLLTVENVAASVKQFKEAQTNDRRVSDNRV